MAKINWAFCNQGQMSQGVPANSPVLPREFSKYKMIFACFNCLNSFTVILGIILSLFPIFVVYIVDILHKMRKFILKRIKI